MDSYSDSNRFSATRNSLSKAVLTAVCRKPINEVAIPTEEASSANMINAIVAGFAVSSFTALPTPEK
eukprot:6948-Heterococcus_DN1.PRE.3